MSLKCESMHMQLQYKQYGSQSWSSSELENMNNCFIAFLIYE